MLEKLLTCKVCDNLVSDPCSLEACDHIFCRLCIEKLVGSDSKCPECGAFAWVKDMKTNRQLANTVTMCRKMRVLVDNNEQSDNGDDDTLMKCHTDNGSTKAMFWEETQHEVEMGADSYQFSSPVDTTTSNSLNKCAAAVKEVSHNHKRTFKKPKCKTKMQKEEQIDVKETHDHTKLNDKQGETNQLGKDAAKLLSCQSGKSESSEGATPEKGSALGSRKLSKRLQVMQKCFGKKSKPTQARVGRKAASLVNEVLSCDELEAENEAQTDCGIADNTSHLQFVEQKLDEDNLELEKGNGVEEFYTRVKLKDDQCERTTDRNEDIESNGKTRAQKRKLRQVQMLLSFASNPQQESQESSDTDKGLKIDNRKRENKSNNDTPVKQGITSRKPPTQNFCSPQNWACGPSAVKRNIRGETPLHVAAIKGCVESVRKILTEGADPNTKDHAGWTPLHEGCNHGYLSIVELLLDYGAMIDTPGGFDHDTPLHDAVSNGRIEVAKLLINSGAPLDIRNKRGLVPIDYATTDEMRAILSASTLKTCSQGSTQLRILSLPENEKFSNGTPKVLLATGLSSEQKANLQTCALTLDAKIVSEFSPSVTHIVTTTNGKGVCPRTIKYLNGVLTGKWIVNYDWIVKCLRQKTWMDERPYEVKGTNDASVDAPKRARINAVKQLPSLFDGCQFFFYGDFFPPHPAKEDLVQMIKYGGGKILSREPKPRVDETLCLPNKVPVQAVYLAPVAYHANPESELYRCTQYIIYNSLYEKKPHIWETMTLRTLPSTWLMDCASNFAILDPE